jgi:hypothetical protein
MLQPSRNKARVDPKTKRNNKRRKEELQTRLGIHLTLNKRREKTKANNAKCKR